MCSAHAETVAGWTVADGGGKATESAGVITLSGDDRAPGPSLYKEFRPETDFEISLQVKAETLGEVHRDPAGAGEGFSLDVLTNNTAPVHGVGMGMRGRAGGQFELGRHNLQCDLYGWGSDWVPFVYNAIGYNDGYSFWHSNPPVDRSNAPVQPDVWYTMKLKVTKTPFTATAEVYAENGTLLGSLTVADMNDLTFNDIRYVSIHSRFGGIFYVKDFAITPAAQGAPSDASSNLLGGWQVGAQGGRVSETHGVLTLSGNDQAAGPSLSLEFHPQTSFEVSFQLKAETLGVVHRDPAGAGEGFGFSFSTNNTPPSHGASFELRARAGGQFLLVWHNRACDLYGWSCDWVPFVYNGIGYNDGSAFWRDSPPEVRANAPVKPGVWYTVKLRVQATPFTFTGVVYAENGTLLGSMTVDDINDFTFEDIRYMGMSSGFGGTFYVRNISTSSLVGETVLPASTPTSTSPPISPPSLSAEDATSPTPAPSSEQTGSSVSSPTENPAESVASPTPVVLRQNSGSTGSVNLPVATGFVMAFAAVSAVLAAFLLKRLRQA